MLLNPLENIFFPIGTTDPSEPPFVHNLEPSGYKDPQTAVYNLTSMLSNTILETRRWTVPALVQDLTSLFASEPTPKDQVESPQSTLSSPGPSLSISCSPYAIDSPVRLPNQWTEKQVRPRTRFVLAHPPPIARSKQRLSARPRMILQLQRASDGSRPLPVFDVISSTSFASRFAHSIPKMMKGEKSLSTDTLAIVRSERYSQDLMVHGETTDDSGDEAANHSRDFLGTISYGKKGEDGSFNQDEICLENGLIWKATCLKEGTYEFTGKYHNGLKLRWVSRKSPRTKAKRHSLSQPSTEPASSRFTFSIINPNTRLHPVIATLTGDHKLDILDRFPTVLSSAMSSPPSSPPQSPLSSDFSSESSFSDRLINEKSSYMETDDALRMLIILTGIWIMSKEGRGEAFSKSLGIHNKPSRDCTDGSPTSVASGAEPSLERSPSSRHIPFRLHRSSTSPQSHKSGAKKSAPPQRAKSSGASGTPRKTVNAPQSATRNTQLLSCALCGGQEEAQQHRSTLDADAYGKTSNLASGRLKDATNCQETIPSVKPRYSFHERTKSMTPMLGGNGFDRESIDSEVVKGKLEKDGLETRRKKMINVASSFILAQPWYIASSYDNFVLPYPDRTSKSRLMAQQPSDRDKLDFTSLTDAIIPSNLYLNSWNETGQPRSLGTQTFPSGLNMFPPTFGSIPLSDTQGSSEPVANTATENHTAFSANALQQFDADTHGQDRGIETVRKFLGQQPQSTSISSRSAVSEGKARLPSTKDPLAHLKMRAKESVMAKRARSNRSASDDSKIGLTVASRPDLMHKGGSNNVFQVEDVQVDSKSCVPSATINAPFVEPDKPLAETHTVSAKATSLELEDLIAEGRAAASLPKTKMEQVRSAAEQHGKHGRSHQNDEQARSEFEEKIRDDISGREQKAPTNRPSPNQIKNLPVDEIDEIDTWLAMTGYYDAPYRNKVLTRRKRLNEIEEEKLRLLEEEHADQLLRGQFRRTTPLPVLKRPNPPATTTGPPTPTAKHDMGLRIKDVASKSNSTAEETHSNDNVSLKRGIEGESADTEALHQSKAARTEVYRRTPPLSQRASPERRHGRSVSPRNGRKHPIALPHQQTPHSNDGYDRLVLGGKGSHCGPADRSLVEFAHRNDHRARYDQRRDSGFSTSDLSDTGLRAGRVRFFLLKSWNYENIATAQREGTWATQTKNEDTFIEAFKTCRHVIFFFSANHSKAFQGYARMQGLPGERGVQQPSWVKKLHWPTTAPFKLRWIVKEETPYRAVGNIKNPLNENLAVFVGRDGQEIPEKLGLQLCDIIDEDTSYQADYRR